MQHLSQNQSSIRNVRAAGSALSIVIIYEDFETGKQAKRTYDYLSKTLGGQTQFTTSMWKFEVLTIPKLREIAAKDAAMADIVIVASHGGGGLPAHVRVWADQWLALRVNSSALVALFDCPKAQAQGIRAELETIALRGDLEFFAQPEEEPLQRWNEPEEAPPLPQVKNRGYGTLSESMRMEGSIPRWGINE